MFSPRGGGELQPTALRHFRPQSIKVKNKSELSLNFLELGYSVLSDPAQLARQGQEVEFLGIKERRVNSSTDVAVKVGRREQNKADKLRRIKAAARKLFVRKGYEATTTREIAEEAGLSVGTVFFYARDKGDLCCLMAVDRIHKLFARSYKNVDPSHTLLDQLTSFFSAAFVDAAKNPSLSRILIKEMVTYKDKSQVDEWVTSRVEKLLDIARQRGELEFDDSTAFVARTVNQLYLAEMRDWIVGDRPDPAEGLATLRRSLFLVFEGLERNHD